MALSGKNARVRVNSTTFLCGVKWTINIRADELDGTCFEDGGFAHYFVGVHEAEISFDGLWIPALHSAPPALVEGTNISIQLFPDQVNIPTSVYSFPNFLLTNVTVETEVRGLVRYTITGKTIGTFTLEGTVIPTATAQST